MAPTVNVGVGTRKSYRQHIIKRRADRPPSVNSNRLTEWGAQIYIDALDDVEAEAGEHAGHRLGVIDRVPKRLGMGVGAVANHQRDAALSGAAAGWRRALALVWCSPLAHAACLLKDVQNNQFNEQCEEKFVREQREAGKTAGEEAEERAPP